MATSTSAGLRRLNSLATLAERIRKWAAIGIDASLVEGITTGLQVDEKESEGRAPRKQGRLVRTIRVVQPSATRAAKRGVIRAGLAAGSRSGDRRLAVAYASVLQTGKVGYPPGAKTRKHPIQARRAEYRNGRISTTGVLSFVAGGRRVFVRRVMHPGSRFEAMNYLQINEPRLARVIDEKVQARIQVDIG
jgi:hypothetical protein